MHVIQQSSLTSELTGRANGTGGTMRNSLRALRSNDLFGGRSFVSEPTQTISVLFATNRFRFRGFDKHGNQKQTQSGNVDKSVDGVGVFPLVAGSRPIWRHGIR